MAKLWKRPVLGGDNDAEAVDVASENAGLNGVDDLCRFVHVDRPATRRNWRSRAPYDLIVANILAGPLVELSESFAPALRPGGRVLLSGLLVEQAAMSCRPTAAAASSSNAASTSRPAAPGGAPCCCAQRLTNRKRAGFRRPFLRLRLRYATSAMSHLRRATQVLVRRR